MLNVLNGKKADVALRGDTFCHPWQHGKKAALRGIEAAIQTGKAWPSGAALSVL